MFGGTVKTPRIIRLLAVVAALALLAGFASSAAGVLPPGSQEQVGTLFNASDATSPQHHPSDSIGFEYDDYDLITATVVDQGYQEGLYATPRKFWITGRGGERTAAGSNSISFVALGDGGVNRGGIGVRVLDKDVSAKYRLTWRIQDHPWVVLKPGTGDAVLNRAHRFALTERRGQGYSSLRIEYLKDGKLRGSVIATRTPGDAGNFDFPAEVVFPEKGKWTIRASLPETGTFYAQTIEFPLYVNRPTFTINQDGVRVTSTRSSRIWGTLTSRAGNPLIGRTIYLKKYVCGRWDTIRTLTTNSTGTVSTYVRPTKPTAYRFYYPGNSTQMERNSYSDNPNRSAYNVLVWVLPKIYFTSVPHSKYSMTYGKSYKVWGDVFPEHPTDSTQFQLLAYKRTKRSNGTYKYVYKAAYTTKVSNPSEIGSRSRYTGYMKLPSKGRWRIRVRHLEDAQNAKSYTGYRYVTVN